MISRPTSGTIGAVAHRVKRCYISDVDSKLLTVSQATRLAGVTRQVLARHDHELRPERDAYGHRRYDPAIVAAWLASRGTERILRTDTKQPK